MKTLLSLVIGLAWLPSALALEYVTLHAGKLAHDIAPGSLVEVIGWGHALSPSGYTITQNLVVTFPGGTTEKSQMFSNGAVDAQTRKFFGVIGIALERTGPSEPVFSVTFKVTPPTEINAAGPTNILVIPENAPGNFDLIVDSSADLVTWTPIFSQTVVNGSASHFFHARLVKK